MRIVPSGNVIGAGIQDVELSQLLRDETFPRIEPAFHAHPLIYSAAFNCEWPRYRRPMQRMTVGGGVPV